MIPRILELKNFLSYGEPLQTIDFSGHSLICLSGKNGNGKSALLDAMTWALWGQARKASGATKADAGLLRLGQTRMLVSLEFEFSQRIYRVRREFAHSYGKPYAALDFEVMDSNGEQFMSLTDKTIRATQEKIDRMLGLDYETFTNSAFLRQGQANEFSKKSSKERKNVLATILGLSKYDNLAQYAQNKSRKLTTDRKCIKALVEQNSAYLSKEEAITKELLEKKKQLKQQIEILGVLKTTLLELEKKQVSCITEKNTLLHVEKEYKEFEKSYHDDLENFRINCGEWKRIHALSLTLPNFKLLQEKKQLLIREDKNLRQAQEQQVKLQEAIIKIKDEYQHLHTQLQKKHDLKITKQRDLMQKQEIQLQHQVTILTHKEKQHKELITKKSELEKRIHELEKNIISHKSFQQDFIKLKDQFDKRRSFYQVLIQRGNWLRSQLTDFKQKQDAIEDHDNPACPLCMQLLTQKRKIYLGKQLAKQGNFLSHQFSRIKNLITRLKKILFDQHKSVLEQEKKTNLLTQTATMHKELLKSNQEIDTDIVTLKKEITVLMIKKAELTGKQNNLKEELSKLKQSLPETLKNDPELSVLAIRLKNHEKERMTLAFNQKHYQTIQEQLSKLDKHITDLQQIKQADAAQDERKKTITQQSQQLKTLKQKLEQIRKKIKKLPELEKEELEIKKETDIANQKLQEINKTKENLFGTIGSLENEKKRLEVLKKDCLKNEEKIKEIDLEISDYLALATAFSKNGIQALLIEDAIPEIEHEANDILSRLTDNQAQIFIESLKDLKSGGVRETLDIHIADSTGSRPYEMYSGGEAFRIDFALRIAISKLLARRAGTALQTLIIDEGFGSQDEEGLARIMQAIYAIQEDFEKIIIVSHLPEFKHNFPVHFIIEKGPSGSLVQIEQRG